MIMAIKPTLTGNDETYTGKIILERSLRKYEISLLSISEHNIHI